MELMEQMPLLEWFANNYKNFGKYCEGLLICGLTLVQCLQCFHLSVVLIHVSNVWIYVMSVQWADWPAFIHSKCTDFQPNVFIPAVLIGTIELFHFISLSMTLTLAGGHKVNRMQNLWTSFSCKLFNWSG